MGKYLLEKNFIFDLKVHNLRTKSGRHINRDERLANTTSSIRCAICISAVSDRWKITTFPFTPWIGLAHITWLNRKQMFQTYSWRNEVDICSYLCISYQYEATRHQVKEGICQSCSEVHNSRKRSFKQINNKMLETNKKTEKAVFRGFSYRINRQIPPSTKNINGINIFCPRGELSPPLIVNSKLLDKSIKRSSLPKIFNKNCFRNN